MSRLKENVPNCCEDHKGNDLCKHLIGVHCNVRHPNGAYIRVTRDGLELLQQVGCALFKAKDKSQHPPMKESCEVCLLFDNCDFKNDMVGKQCPKFRVNKGVLGQDNWT
jgi:hypothetical protein